ncbi:hypothetical protein [Acidithiobacillus ferrooxidans]|uniref:hypothetical protein n=1 Tax=Acidithiobacillus ferrooxidans TaxID=920 RepID=UPI001E5C1F9E|nr:hypothetical protein [Acidithiobacillus ferrooxidans]BDB15045.1 hypothetical protein ANFP_23650 [Acidithiobacillus ferrooxidans]
MSEVISKAGQLARGSNVRLNDDTQCFHISDELGRCWPLRQDSIKGALHKKARRNLAFLHGDKIPFFGSLPVIQRSFRLKQMRRLDLHQTELLLNLPHRRLPPPVVMGIGDNGTVRINA